MAPFGGKQRPFLAIILGITEVFGPDGSFAAPAGFRIVTNGLIWLFKGKRLPTPGIGLLILTTALAQSHEAVLFHGNEKSIAIIGASIYLRNS